MFERFYQYVTEKTPIENEVYTTICQHLHFKKVVKGEYLLMEGEVCYHNYFVLNGCIRLYAVNEEGNELTRYFAFPGKFGTSLSSFIEKKPSIEYIQAVENSEILSISRVDFYHLVERYTSFNLIYLDILEMAYITSQKRIYGLQGESALERLKWLLDYQPDIFTRLSSKVIASYLGITPYTLSRLKAEL